MITDFLLDERIFVYIVCVNDGFYMEPDITIKKVFLDYKDAKQYCNQLNKTSYAFIEKRRLYL